jgi:drug/metabolite transporter (DMT)-like permease
VLTAVPAARFGEIAAVGAAFVWAAAVILFRRSGSTIGPVGLNLLKSAIGVLFLALTIPLTGEQVAAGWTAQDWLLVVLSGILGIAVGDTLFLACLNRIGAALWSIIDCLYGPLVLAFAFAFLGERLTPARAAGGMLILAAVLLVSVSRQATPAERHRLASGIGLGLLAVVAMAAGTVLARPVVEKSGLVSYSAIRMAVGAAPLLLTLVRPARRTEVAAAFRPSRAWRFAIPASVCGSYLGMMLWLAGIKHTLVGVATLLNQLTVVITIVFAWIFLREPLGGRTLVALALAVGGATLLFWY